MYSPAYRAFEMCQHNIKLATQVIFLNTWLAEKKKHLNHRLKGLILKGIECLCYCRKKLYCFEFKVIMNALSVLYLLNVYLYLVVFLCFVCRELIFLFFSAVFRVCV